MNLQKLKAISFRTLLCLFVGSFYFTAAPAQTLKEKLQKKLQQGGKESTLEDKKVTAIKMVSSENPVLAPGARFEIGITATLDDGTEMLTRGLSQGKVKWGNYIVNVVGGTFNDGDVTINDDPRKIKDYKIVVTAKLLFDSTKTQTLEFTLDFKANYVADFSGRSGESQPWAKAGQSGGYGQNNSTGRGGDGIDGQKGEDGRRGGNGYNGDAVDVYVTAFKDAAGKTMLKVYAKSRSSNREEFYIVNPEGGSITISARGGRGGQGEHGGDGGGGGPGGNGHEKGGNPNEGDYGVGGTGGKGGDGGNGGDGGDGGNGGSITIFVDPSASAYVSIIKYDTSGGSAGDFSLPGNGAGGGSGGDADTHGQTGQSGRPGRNGVAGRAGQNGPTPLIITQKVNIDWDKVAAGMN